jgi:serine/threonine-protein kinase HipA
MTMMLPEKIRQLRVDVGGQPSGELIKQSPILFKYLADDFSQAPVGLLMPANKLVYQSANLFPVMDQNLPEGYLFERIRASFPKQALSAFHLLALIGENGIGRLGFRLPDASPPDRIAPLSRSDLLRTRIGPELFETLVQAYLSTGIGIAGIQPKIMVPDRATVAVPNLIVKSASDAYPGLAANEFMCLSAARLAGIETPDFELSDDGQLLLLDRFDITGEGERLGFEDVASLMGLCVRDTLSDRKYQGSYERIADLIKLLGMSAHDLQRFFEQVLFSIMVRNGDGHLKNYGVLYDHRLKPWLSPMYDVVTTSIYRYTRYAGGPELEDRTLALRLFRKSATKAYPVTEEIIQFGRQVCGVQRPTEIISRIAQAMDESLQEFANDDRIPSTLFEAMQQAWLSGIAYAKTAAH